MHTVRFPGVIPAYNARKALRRRGSAGPLPLQGRARAEAVVILQATMRQSGDVTILDLEGRATIGPANDLLAAELARLIKGGARKLLVNLRGVKQVDSSSISTLVRTFVSLQSAGGSLKLLGPQGRVRAVLGLTRLLNVIPNFDDEAGALASFR